jgi:ketosteroid isomerase-like protein
MKWLQQVISFEMLIFKVTHMNKRLWRAGVALLYTIAGAGCGSKTVNPQTVVQEIEATETAFKKLAADSGVGAAFFKYAASEAVMIRGNDSMIKGAKAIRNYYDRPQYKNATVDWKPDFVQPARAGDLAYSYGRYLWVFTDSAGKKTDYRGHYLTIWKKQADGGWKFVWD